MAKHENEHQESIEKAEAELQKKTDRRSVDKSPDDAASEVKTHEEAHDSRDESADSAASKDEAKPGDTADAARGAGLDTQADRDAAEADEVEPLTISSGESEDTPARDTQSPSSNKGWWRWVRTHKKLTIPGVIVVMLAILAAVPATRYAAAGLVLKQNFKIAVVDSQTGKPVTNATIDLHGTKALTDNRGLAVVHVAVGDASLSVSKQYYRSSSAKVRVPIFKQKTTDSVALVATGRQVPVTVLNRITGKPVANAQVSAAGTEVRTDSKGEATLVLPANAATATATISASGYNALQASVKVTVVADAANNFQIVPAGKVYFLSNASGKIDVVKTNLDGSGRQTVLAGTGSEDARSTALLASRDWKYLVLYAKRTTAAADTGSLFLIDTSNDQLTSIDSGNATFVPIGWDGDSFVYQVNRNNYANGQPKAQALKTYDAAAKKIVVLDETNAAAPGGGFYWGQSFGNIFILGDEIVYSKALFGYDGAHMQNVPAGFYSIKADGSGKRTIKEYVVASGESFSNASVNFDAQVYDQHGFYFQGYSYGMASLDNTIYKYDDGKLTAAANQSSVYANQDQNGYPTYLASPSGSQTFWSEPRDGKTSLFVGDSDAQNARTVLSTSDYASYGWYTDSYLLVSKNSSELYIMSAAASGNTQPLKVTDYYRPDLRFYGYGGGYGGL